MGNPEEPTSRRSKGDDGSQGGTDSREGQPAEQARQWLAAIVDSSDDAIISKDLDGVITSWNQGAEHIFGYSAEEVIGKPITVLIPPDRQDEEPEILKRIQRGERLRHYETVRRRKDSSPIDISLTVSPVKDAAGRVIGASKIARDISDKKDAERSLQAQRWRLARLNRIAKTVSQDLELDHVMQTVTDAATEVSGAQYGAFFHNNSDDNGEALILYSLSGASREAFADFGVPRNTDVFEPTFRGTSIVRSDDIRQDPRYGKNAPHYGLPKGHLPIVSYLAVPVISRSREVLGGLFLGHPEAGVFTKESERLVRGIAAHAATAVDNARLHEDALREIERRRKAEDANELLIKELRHRAKNTLATVQAIATQTFRHASDEEYSLFSDRLQALSGTHDLLTERDGQWASVGAIIQHALAPFQDREQRVNASGIEAWLDAEQALLLSMVIHELATNAVKYGALSNDQGGVHVSWHMEEAEDGGNKRVRIDWHESGGPKVRAPTSKGFGTNLIERMVRRNGGSTSYEFAPDGLRCTLEFALG